MPKEKPVISRRLFGAISLSMIFSGCVKSSTSELTDAKATTLRQSENINQSRVINYSELPGKAQQEVQAAVNSGYASCNKPRLLEEIELENNPLIMYKGTYYKPVVSSGSGDAGSDCESRYRLELKRHSTLSTPERSSDRIVPYEKLSQDAQHEVDTALNDGKYTSCQPLTIAEQIDLTPPPKIEIQGKYYRPSIDRREARTTKKCDIVFVLEIVELS